ncbi:MAG: hypothetical protein Q7V88_18670 [Actinomycetota bacterium]|nr:hypothetical protein [Actinomycetota bacterium]
MNSRVGLALATRAALAAIVAATASFALVAGADDEVSTVARAWIDDPLDGSAVGERVSIVAHATSLRGLSAMELNIDGVLIADAPGGTGLVTARWTWAPPAAGAYQLVARGVEPGATSYIDSAPVIIVVGGNPDEAAAAVTRPPVVEPATTSPSTGSTISPPASTVPGGSGTTTPGTGTTTPTTRTTTPTTRTTPTTPPTTPPTTLPPTPSPSTSPPTTAGCTMPTPVPDFPTGGAVVSERTPTLLWTVPGGCAVSGYQIQLTSDADFAGVDIVGSSESEWWTVPSGSPLANCTNYFWRVRAVAGGTAGAWSDIAGFTVSLGGC